MRKYSVSAMTLDDISEVKRIEEESSLSSWSIEDYRDEVTRENSICLIARSPNEGSDVVAGFLLARIFLIEPQAKTGALKSVTSSIGSSNFVEINNIAVGKPFRNLGLGSRLIKELIESISRFEIREIWLEVRESNTSAIRFYKNNGFATQQMRENYYKNPDENAVLMRLEFPK